MRGPGEERAPHACNAPTPRGRCAKTSFCSTSRRWPWRPARRRPDRNRRLEEPCGRCRQAARPVILFVPLAIKFAPRIPCTSRLQSIKVMAEDRYNHRTASTKNATTATARRLISSLLFDGDDGGITYLSHLQIRGRGRKFHRLNNKFCSRGTLATRAGFPSAIRADCSA